MMLQTILQALYRCYKHLVRLATHSSEIGRICQQQRSTGLKSCATAEQSIAIHRSLQRSKQLRALYQLMQDVTSLQRGAQDLQQHIPQTASDTQYAADEPSAETAVADLANQYSTTIQQYKLITAKPHRQLLNHSVCSIISVNHLRHNVIPAVCQPYGSENELHEKLLRRLYDATQQSDAAGRSSQAYERYGEHWSDIGFQGSDPATDFRGVGVFGLLQLITFVERSPASWQRVIQHFRQQGPLKCFSPAITGIALTNDVVALLGLAGQSTSSQQVKHNALQHWLFSYGSTLDSLHLLYAVLFASFDEHWQDVKPATVMDYSTAHRQWLDTVVGQLQRGTLKPTQQLLRSYGQA